MVRYFDNYKLEVKKQKIKLKNNIFSEKTAVLTFLDKDKKELKTIELGYFAATDIYEKINNKSDLFLNNSFVESFSLEEFRKINNLKENKLITMRNFTAENSFFAGEDEISFKRANFIGNKADFSKSIFFAPKVDFSEANFEKSEANFEYITFNTSSLSFKSSFFGDYNVDFKNAIFCEGTKDFEEITFGKGDLIFLNAEFNKGDISFSGSKIGDGRTIFRMSRFDKGKIDFSRVVFGDGDVSFEKAIFGAGEITFRSAIFGQGKKDFTRCNFGKGKKIFINTNFGKGNITFKNSNFGDGKVSFKLANFGYGNCDFHFVKFGKEDLIFERTQFNDGQIDFRGTEFGEGRVVFNKIEIGNGDITFEGSEMKSGAFLLKLGVFGNGTFDFENALFKDIDFLVEDVNFGEGKVSFKKSQFNSLIFKSSQLNNYFDLRVKKCKKLDLSNTIVKDILDISSFEFNIEIDEFDFTGLRLLGRLYIDWERSNVKKLIYQQKTSYRNKSEQFRTLKENYRNIGMYQSEDYAYVEFKRTETKADLEDSKNKNVGNKILGNISYFIKWLIFDKMGLYATEPMRVLLSMGIVYLTFVILFLINGVLNTGGILYSIGDGNALSSILKTFYFGAVTFLTIGYGDYYPIGANRFIVALEGFAGLFMMSYFTVAFVRKILR